MSKEQTPITAEAEKYLISKQISMEEKVINTPDYNYSERHDVRIEELNYGVVVSVGCKRFAFESVEKALEELKLYYTNKDECVKKWEKHINK